ncbi:MAG TPA: sorbosone dehydrogenase family protein [Rudaea sp.]|nr:sorbosone dehydrogenase family protein [Rudaea sp.]
MHTHAGIVGGLLIAAVAAVASTLPESAGYGPHPQLPPPKPQTIPTIKIAPTRPWSGAETPQAAAGFAVNEFARNLAHPRMLYVLPNGDVLVAETDTPEKPQDYKGIKGTVMKFEQRRAGAGHGSANRLTLLRDADANGVAETQTVFLQGLNSPYGMSLVGDSLYVANTDSLVRVPYHAGETKVTAVPTRIAGLPGGSINHHWTKNLVASRDRRHLYVSVGSNSNAGENGIEAETDRASILEVDPSTGKTRVYASGLRNPVGLAWQPDSGALWTSVNERDELGDDLVPDYMTSVHDGAFYGFPYSYYGAHLDPRVQPARPDLAATAQMPDYALGAHTASLGLVFYDGDAFPQRYRGGAFVGQHGSWNRSQASGYKVVFVPFDHGKPSGAAEDILTGFLDAQGNARGRPVGVAVDRHGALLVADDVGGRVWRVTSTVK